MQRKKICRFLNLYAHFHKLVIVIRQVVGGKVIRHGQQRCRKSFRIRKFSKAIFEVFNHLRHIFRLHLPQRHWPGKQSFVGVGNVKIILQLRAGGSAVEHGNACAALVHPASKMLIPAFHFKHRSSVGLLGIYQQLLVKRQFIISGSRLQKSCPFVRRLCNPRKLIVIKIGDKLQL